MPLEILAPMVLIGIWGIALLLHFMGDSSRSKLYTAGDAIVCWNAQNPDISATQARLSDDGHHALVYTTSNIGLVWSMGKDFTAREIHEPPSILQDKTGLVVKLNDFSAPKVIIKLKNKTDRVAGRHQMIEALNYPDGGCSEFRVTWLC